MLCSAYYRTSLSQASVVQRTGDSAGIPICSPPTTNWILSPCNFVVCFERLYCLSARFPWITFVSSSPFSSRQSRSSVTTWPVRLLLPAAGGSGALPLATQEMGPAQAEQRLRGAPDCLVYGCQDSLGLPVAPRKRQGGHWSWSRWMRGRGYRCLVEGVIADHVGAMGQGEEFVLVVLKYVIT